MLPTKFRFIQPSGSEEKIFLNRPIRSKNCLCRLCLLMYRENNYKLYRGPAIDATYQISVLLGERFRGKDFLEINKSKKKWPVVAMFVNGSELNEQSLQKTFQEFFLPSLDSFGQAVSEEKIFQKSTNQKQEWPVAAMFVSGSKQIIKLYRRPLIDASYQVSVHLAKRCQRKRF